MLGLYFAYFGVRSVVPPKILSYLLVFIAYTQAPTYLKRFFARPRFGWAFLSLPSPNFVFYWLGFLFK